MLRLGAIQLNRPLSEAETAALTAAVPPERLARLSGRGGRRAQVLCAYGLLLALLRDNLGWDRLPDMARTRQGKPYFPAAPWVQFSLAHTDGGALAAVSDTTVGVDLERIRPAPGRLRARLDPTGTEESFFRLWTGLEARAKQTGQGLSLPPVPPERPEPPLALWPGYAAACASDQAVEGIRLFTPEELVTTII